MSTVIPQSELARRAIDWITEQCACRPGQQAPGRFIEDAAARFNLGPLDVEFLQRFFANGAKGEQAS